jgi:hypothetical protein
MRRTEAIQGVRMAMFLNILHRWEPCQTVRLPQATISPPAQCGSLGLSRAHGPRFRARLSESLASAPQIARRSARSRTPSLSERHHPPLSDLRQNRQSLPPLPALSRSIPRSLSENSPTSIRAFPVCQLRTEMPRTKS